MKTMTLVTRRLYFGVDALRLRDATGRVLSRLQGLPPDHATVHLDALVEDFRVSAAASRMMVEQMVQGGYLERLSPGGTEYGITDKFRQCAEARLVEPLPRTRAQMLLAHIVDLAERFNRSASHNKYEIEAIAVFGGYMSLDADLAELSVGVTGRRRPPGELSASGRASTPTEGHEQIRTLLETQSNFVQASFYQRLQDVPRPFSVIFKDQG